MQYMLAYTDFDQHVEYWDVSRVQDMRGMFQSNPSFNKPLHYWKVSSVTTMRRMFARASSFNQPLEHWDVSKVMDLRDMFMDASHFDQDLCLWGKKLPPNANVTNMFARSYCHKESDPILNKKAPGPLCVSCGYYH